MNRWRHAFKVQVRDATQKGYIKPTREDRELVERYIAQHVDFTKPTLDEIQRLKDEAEKHLLFYSLGTIHRVYLHLRKYGETQLGFINTATRSPIHRNRC